MCLSRHLASSTFAFTLFALLVTGVHGAEELKPNIHTDEARGKDWIAFWEKNIQGDAKNRYCDKSMGEDIAWLVTPFADGFYYGYLATGDRRWADRLIEWTDSWVKRGVKEPDGFIGWPSLAAAGTQVDQLDDFDADSMLADAMASRAPILFAAHVAKDRSLQLQYAKKAREYIDLGEMLFKKWDTRGAWREIDDSRGISVVLPYGLDRKTGNWKLGYNDRNQPGHGFSHPNNKANEIARWLLSLYDATGKKVYRQRAERWFKTMKSRMKVNSTGTYEIWNYWEPAGPWDYKADRSPKHWVGVHPNAGYYQIDVGAIVDAYEHGIVFDTADINRLMATALHEKRYWDALAPYNTDIQAHFQADMKPDSWGALSGVPNYLSYRSRLRLATSMKQ